MSPPTEGYNVTQMIGERLREARETRGLSLTDVATKAHISAATL